MAARRDAVIETRWNVAVHEAGHVVIGKKVGVRGRLTATVRTDGRGRSRGFTRTSHCRFYGDALDEAVFCLAGSAASRLITGDPALRDSTDVADAEQALAGTRHSMKDAERRAAHLVRKHRGDIEQAARRLYDTGRI